MGHDGVSGVPEDTIPLAPPGQQEIFCGAFLQRQQEAISDVAQMLSQYEDLEDLYPTSRTMTCLLGDEFDDILSERLNVMYVWLNITRDLCRKIRDIGFMLGMHRPQNATDFSGDWPNLDYQSPDPSRLPSPVDLSSTGELDMEEPAETPENHRPRGSSGTFASTLSRTTSEHEIVSTAVMYHKFVEKSLRLRGMRKVLQRVAEVTEKTLAKARRALQRPESIQSPDEAHGATMITHKRSFVSPNTSALLGCYVLSCPFRASLQLWLFAFSEGPASTLSSASPPASVEFMFSFTGIDNPWRG